MTICAIYARVSDETQVKGDSIEHQIGFCKEQARRRSAEEGVSWITPDEFVYVDEGISGTSMVKRPSVQRLISQARENAFEVVLFKGISRFARDTVDALLMLRSLTACGVRVISMEENFDSRRDSAEFIFTIHSALAQAESEKTAIRVRVGSAQKARAGKWNGAVPIGYLLDNETKHLRIDESTAIIVREIFSMYVSGLGVRRIADALNSAGRYTPNGKLWTQRNISRLLKNPVYMGDVVYGRRETHTAFPDESDPLLRKKRAVWVNDPEQTVVCNDAHPAIIPRTLFQEIQSLMGQRRTTPGPARHRYLLTKGLLRCTCGASMTITYNRAGTAYYRCRKQHESGGSACRSGHIRALDLERLVLQRVRADVLNSVSFDDLSLPVQENESLQDQLRRVEHSLRQQLAKSQRLFDEYTDGRFLDEQFRGMNEHIQIRIQSLQQSAGEIRQRLAGNNLDGNQPGMIRQRLLAALDPEVLYQQTQSIGLARETLRLFVESVCASAGPNGIKQVTIRYQFSCPQDDSKQ
ncbi:recombinase family protein [Alicyclobacillus ferrooxydans]|uniref:recombinase family protein n=1 Tax=Alicyclobacillus ferrooxydans TaxID=471514 RepID=UPI0006D55993|nr:recombinase family protein [Alicyclobacillus ferrooxydans]